ncbi:MAG: hypothetical protein K2P51_08610 [Rhabdochlamydiaceae bacterium]|nr:hypothetical protein [Rhabdochlamydiaceae bacterium]
MTVRFTQAQFNHMFRDGGLEEALAKGKLLTTSLGTTSNSFFGSLFNDVDQNRIAASISRYVNENKGEILSYKREDQEKIKNNLQLLQEKFSGISRKRSPDARVRAHTLITNLPRNHRTRVSYDHFLKAMTPLSILERRSPLLTPFSPTSNGKTQVQTTLNASSKKSQPKKRNKNKPSQPATTHRQGTSSAASSIPVATPPKPSSTPASTPTIQPPAKITQNVSEANKALVAATSRSTAGSTVALKKLPEDHPVMQQIALHEKGYRLENGKLVHHKELAVPKHMRFGKHPSGTLINLGGEMHVQYIVMKPSTLGYFAVPTVRKQDQVYDTSGLTIDFGALIREQHAKVTEKK